MEVMYSCGIRRSELRNLNIEGVEKEELHIQGKGGTIQLVMLYSLAALVIVSVKRVINQILKEQVGAGFSPHKFRHACAIHMLKNGCSVRVLQKYLGHEKLSSTQIYTRVDTGDLKQMVNKHHPRK